MAVIRIVKTIKQIHPKDVLLVKIGSFYHAYGKDAIILSYLFNYKIKIQENIYTCGFPLASYKKVISKLEDKKINYLMVDRRNNYEKDEENDNKNLNTYEEIYKIAHIYIRCKKRIDNINTYLYNNLHNKEIYKKIKEIEEILNEG